MKKRPGFTLAELILAVIIFGFMSTSLATIYSTANRNMFQNYRSNIIKTNVGLSMRAIQNTLTTATRLDAPLYNSSGNILAFASNVDQLSGCYPVNSAALSAALIGTQVSPASPPTWHYFCIAPDASLAGVNSLYYHTGVIPGGSGCDAVSPTTWNGTGPNGYPAYCGFGGGGTVTLLMQAVQTSQDFFTRRNTDDVYERDLVLVRLRSQWSASMRGFGKSQRDVDFTLRSAVKVNIPVQ